MRDFRPHHWPKKPVPAPPQQARDGDARCHSSRPGAEPIKTTAKGRLRDALEELPEIEVGIADIC